MKSKHKTVRLDSLVVLLVDAQKVASDNGLFVTMHAINRAQNALGWELAGDVERAGRAGRGEDR